jgi:hypothetical protein
LEGYLLFVLTWHFLMCVNRGREEEKEGRQRERRQRVLSVFIH